MSAGRFLIYGANGFTGTLAAGLAAAEGDAPVLAGRSRSEVQALAERLDLPWRCVSLTEPRALADALADVDLVLHCAGPFSATSRPMVDACLRSGTHYLDITGEVQVFEQIYARHAEAEAAGVVLLPGAGFDVVPSDCLAASLARALPGAVQLELAFASRGGGLSPGTAKTALEGLPQGGCVRLHGRLTRTPAAHRARRVPFPGGPRHAVAIPWGDLASAYRSTGIPNITVFMAAPPAFAACLRLLRPFAGLLGGPRPQRLGRLLIDRLVRGPDAAARRTARVELWGQARDAAGATVEGSLVVPEGYSFTATAALACAERVLAGEVPPGAWTPSQAFGPDFVASLPGVDWTPPEASGGPGAEPPGNPTGHLSPEE